MLSDPRESKSPSKRVSEAILWRTSRGEVVEYVEGLVYEELSRYLWRKLYAVEPMARASMPSSRLESS